MRHVALHILLTLCALSFSRTAYAELRVVATLPDLGSIAEAVGGDDVRVTVMVTATEDPHYVDPRPSHLVELRRADVLIANGLGLEGGWLPPLQVQSRNPSVQTGGDGYVEATGFMPRLLGVERRVDRALGDVHPGGNPHITFDARAGAAIAEGLGATFARLDPPNAGAYQSRASAYADALTTFAAEQRARFDALSPEQRRVIVYHDSLPYLVEWLGLEQVGTLEPLPGVAPDPARVANIIGVMRELGASAVIQEAYYPRSTSQRVAALADATLVVVDGGAREGTTYMERLQSLTTVIFEALAP